MKLQHTHYHRHGGRVHSHEHEWDTLMPEGAERYVDASKDTLFYPSHDYQHRHTEGEWTAERNTDLPMVRGSFLDVVRAGHEVTP